jgi:elongation factor G
MELSWFYVNIKLIKKGGVGAVQSQSYTVDRQMKRYNVPRICFINKLDRLGASHINVLSQVRQKLNLNAALIQIPIGMENNLEGVIDIIERKAYYFEGKNGEFLVEKEIPQSYIEEVEEKRTVTFFFKKTKTLIEKVADVDEVLQDFFLEEKPITTEDLQNAIRRQTILNKFVPVCCGSAKKNTGIQLLLDNVIRFLPSPSEV